MEEGVITQPETEPEQSSGKSMSPRAELEIRKRVRTPRILPNASTLGEIHSVGADVVECLDEADVATYKEPETFLELQQCAENKEWKKTRALERKALDGRDVMEVVPTPTGVKPIKSRYVYKRNTTRTDQSRSTRRDFSHLVMVRWPELM